MSKTSTKLVLLLICACILLFHENIQAQLKANFTTYLDSGCTPLYDTFINTSSGGKTPYTYYWSIGTSNHATTKNCTGIFKTPGIVNIKLTMTDADGKSDSITKAIKVKGSPVADYSTRLTNCSVIHFQASEDSVSSTPIINYVYGGEGAPGYGPLYLKGQTGGYTYTRGGNYHYNLTITGANGCTTIYNDSVHIPLFPSLIVPLDTTVCSNSYITIKVTALNGTKPYRFWWGNLFAHITDTILTRKIANDTAMAVHILDANGCTDYDSIFINTYKLPDPNWKANYMGDSVVFRANDSALTNSSYKWNFGDGDSAYGNRASHLFPKNSDYMVRLNIIDQNGCVNEHDSLLNITKSNIEVYKTDIFNLEISPNPFASRINIQYNLLQNSTIQIGLYDLAGKEITQIINENQNIGLHQTEINTEKYYLMQGMYLLKLRSDYSSASRLIVRF